MAYKGSAEAWCQRMASQVNLIDEPSIPDTKPTHKVRLLRIHCPECNAEVDSTRMKLKVKAGYCSITCKQCRTIKLSSKWRCACGELWNKCGVHVQMNLIERSIKRNGLFSKGRARKRGRMGIDAPFPRQVRNEFVPEAIAIEGVIVKSQRFLQEGSRLALRFAHLVKAAAPT